MLIKSKIADEKPKGGYHPKKASGWGAAIGAVIALILAIGLGYLGLSYVSDNYEYFDATRQYLLSDEMYPPVQTMHLEPWRQYFWPEEK